MQGEVPFQEGEITAYGRELYVVFPLTCPGSPSRGWLVHNYFAFKFSSFNLPPLPSPTKKRMFTGTNSAIQYKNIYVNYSAIIKKVGNRQLK